MAELAQAGIERFAQLGIVFENEQSHRASVPQRA
jgi:hypothetical protein